MIGGIPLFNFVTGCQAQRCLSQKFYINKLQGPTEIFLGKGERKYTEARKMTLTQQQADGGRASGQIGLAAAAATTRSTAATRTGGTRPAST